MTTVRITVSSKDLAWMYNVFCESFETENRIKLTPSEIVKIGIANLKALHYNKEYEITYNKKFKKVRIWEIKKQT